MGRFDSPLQVAGLFFLASFVSVGFIFVINAEAQSRKIHQHQNAPAASHSRNESFSNLTSSGRTAALRGGVDGKQDFNHFQIPLPFQTISDRNIEISPYLHSFTGIQLKKFNCTIVRR